MVIIAWPFSVLSRGGWKKDSRIGCFSYSEIWGNHRDRSSVQSFSLLQSLFWSLDQKRRRRNFRKWVGPLRNGREPIFVTIPLPEFISGQAVRLASSKFWEVVSIFKGRHRFNRSIKNGKRHVRIFPAGGDPALWPKKIYFHENIQRDALFTEKVVLHYRCKTRYMLGENCPAITPTQKDSSYVFHWAEWYSFTESKPYTTWPFCRDSSLRWTFQQLSAPMEDVVGRDNSEEASDSDSDSVSKSE